MIHKPPIDELAAKVGSKYELCVVASKRARQIMEQQENHLTAEAQDRIKPLSQAAQELYDGKISVTND